MSKSKYFEDLTEMGQNSVDNLVRWMQEAEVIEKTTKAEKEAKELFKDAKDESRVTQAEFTKVLDELATKKKESFEELTRKLDTESDFAKDLIGVAQDALDTCTVN